MVNAISVTAGLKSALKEIGDIFTSGGHLLSLISDILDLSKVEAGKMTLDLEPVTVSSLILAVQQRTIAAQLHRGRRPERRRRRATEARRSPSLRSRRTGRRDRARTQPAVQRHRVQGS